MHKATNNAIAGFDVAMAPAKPRRFTIRTSVALRSVIGGESGVRIVDWRFFVNDVRLSRKYMPDALFELVDAPRALGSDLGPAMFCELGSGGLMPGSARNTLFLSYSLTMYWAKCRARYT